MKNRVILLGPPATGKGTQAALLAATFGLPAVSTGAMLRDQKARGTALGLEAASWTDQGRLFPDELALRVVWEWIDGRTRFILDGFPRTIGQAIAFDEGLVQRGLPLDAVYFLDLPEELIRDRMCSRLTCQKCGAVFNESFHDINTATPCPSCGGVLARRDDDTVAALNRRLKDYNELTFPLVNYYTERGLLTRIDASPDRETVYRTLYQAFSQTSAPADVLKQIPFQEGVAA